MAVLINGNGNPAVYANQDADWFASIMGNTTAITGVGQQFAATQEDANTISVADGVIITKEGRRIQLDANESDIFDIPTGTQGTTSYYIIGYHLVTDETSAQSCDTFVQLMDNGTDTIDEDTFRGGADEVYVSLYRVTQTGLNITAIDLLLPTVSNLSQISTNISGLEGDYEVIYDTPIQPNTTGSDITLIKSIANYRTLVFVTALNNSVIGVMVGYAPVNLLKNLPSGISLLDYSVSQESSYLGCKFGYVNDTTLRVTRQNQGGYLYRIYGLI